MLIKQMTFLFLLTSCALFKGQPSLKNKNQEKLLDSVKILGEGTGRLGLGQGQYLFSVDSIFKENTDWILAVTIPLHGEEVMIFPNLKQKDATEEEMQSFEQRIQREFHKVGLSKIVTTEEFLKALRSLIRFNLSTVLGVKRNCKAHQNHLVCEFDGEEFKVSSSDRELNISKSLGQGRMLQLDAKNLTDSFFEQSDIRLYSNEADSTKKNSSFSLELFWKN
jgi:hypothetical protein